MFQIQRAEEGDRRPERENQTSERHGFLPAEESQRNDRGSKDFFFVYLFVSLSAAGIQPLRSKY